MIFLEYFRSAYTEIFPEKATKIFNSNCGGGWVERQKHTPRMLAMSHCELITLINILSVASATYYQPPQREIAEEKGKNRKLPLKFIAKDSHQRFSSVV